jgi:hypothetical protein
MDTSKSTVPYQSQEGLRTRQNTCASGIDPMSTCKTYLDCTRSGKNPSMILELPCISRLELASGVMTHQREHRSIITRELLENSATETGKAAGAIAMT